MLETLYTRPFVVSQPFLFEKKALLGFGNTLLGPFICGMNLCRFCTYYTQSKQSTSFSAGEIFSIGQYINCNSDMWPIWYNAQNVHCST